MHYTVCFLFDHNNRVLLQTKDRTDFKGKLNGVGGKFKLGEFPFDCAMREIKEETGAEPKALVWLGDFHCPTNADERYRLEECHLHFFAGFVDPAHVSQQPGETEKLGWYNIQDILADPTNPQLAGDGDAWYFIYRGVQQLNIPIDIKTHVKLKESGTKRK